MILKPIFRAMLCAATFLAFAGANAQAQVTDVYQKEFLELQINQSFKRLLQSWSEERFDTSLYQLGTSKSKSLIASPEFSERMNNNKWTIDAGSTKVQSIELVEVTYAIITVELVMVMKLRRSREVRFKTIFESYYEEQSGSKFWRFDLLKVLALPYKI